MNWSKLEKFTKEENNFKPIKVKIKKLRSDEDEQPRKRKMKKGQS